MYDPYSVMKCKKKNFKTLLKLFLKDLLLNVIYTQSYSFLNAYSAIFIIIIIIIYFSSICSEQRFFKWRYIKRMV